MAPFFLSVQSSLAFCLMELLFFSFMGGAPRLESLFPPVLWESCNQIQMGFRVIFPEDSQALCQVLRLGSLMWGSKPSQQWENFFGLIVLELVGHPPDGYGVWFCRECAFPAVLLQLLLGLWTWDIFMVVSIILLQLVVQQLVVILVLSQKKVSTRFYSAILNLRIF